jgi:MFS family permease
MTSADVTAAGPRAVPQASMRRLQRRMMTTLIVSQVFGTVGSTAGYTVAAVISVSLIGSSTLSGVVQAVSSIGTIAAAALLARIGNRAGRRASLSFGYGTGLCGALVCVFSISHRSFIGFSLGAVLVSVASVTNLQARYGAADLSRPGSATRNISIVVWVSTIGSVAGPNISSLGSTIGRRLGVPAWSGVYLIGGAGFAIAALALTIGLRPDPLLTARAQAAALAAAAPQQEQAADATPAAAQPPAERPAQTRIFREGARAIRGSRSAVFALASITVGHSVMIAVMTWTPVHMSMAMGGDGAAVASVGAVLSGHFVGMYAFSPALGWAADRYGRTRMMFASALVMLAALAVAGPASSDDVTRLTCGLFLLGIAWCGMFVIGSSLLTESVPDESRVAAQGLTDTFIWVCSGCAVAVAGWIMAAGGYAWLSAAGALLTVGVAAFGLVQVAALTPAAAAAAPSD